MTMLNFQVKRASTKATIDARKSVRATAGIVMIAEFRNFWANSPTCHAVT
jgi:hypothetical protein